MTVDIPDELLYTIFGEILSYSDDDFRRPSMIKPEVLDPTFWPCSSVLLVCKRWLRVATPLLYHTVIVRNVAQGQALEDVFLEKPSLSGLVRKLRVESSWDCLGPVIERCINTEVFLMFLDVHSREGVKKFCRALRYIRPEEAILYSVPNVNNNKVTAILEAFADAMPEWDQLKSFGMPLFTGFPSEAVTKLVNALSVSSSLQNVFAEVPLYAWPTVWNPLATNTQITFHLHSNININIQRLPYLPRGLLPRIRFFDPPWYDPPWYYPPWSLQHQLQQTPSQPTRPVSLAPLLSQPHGVVCVILTKIFIFATVPQDVDERFHEDFQKDLYIDDAVALRHNLSLTCKLFAKVMGPIIYGYPIFLHEMNFFEFVDIVIEKSLGTFIRGLVLDFCVSSWVDFNAALCALLPQLTNLRRFKASREHKISFRAFSLLARASGNVLARMDIKSWEIDDTPRTAAMWNGLKKLQQLRIERLPDPPSPRSILPSCLSQVDDLHVALGDVYVVRLLSHLTFPNLTVLTIVVNANSFDVMVQFLQWHGQRLTELTIVGNNLKKTYNPDLHNYCANLRVLRLRSSYRDHIHKAIAILLANFTPLPHLETLDFIDLPIISTGVLRFFVKLELCSFPRLKKVLVDYKWPQSERTILCETLPHCAERLKKEYGVDMVGTGGRMWRPRLRPRR